MRASWLVQRLNEPMPAHALLGKDNPFAFGGGYKNGGLSDDAMDLLRGVWSFDYMGAAEFEWGAVPKALGAIAQAADAGTLEAWSFTIQLTAVPKHWRDKTETRPTGEATIYVICQDAHREEVEARIREWATANYGLRLKEMPMLAQSLRPDPEYPSRTKGWLELDNGFLFFTDQTMWEKASGLFGLGTAASGSE